MRLWAVGTDRDSAMLIVAETRNEARMEYAEETLTPYMNTQAWVAPGECTCGDTKPHWPSEEELLAMGWTPGYWDGDRFIEADLSKPYEVEQWFPPGERRVHNDR